jgi:hypothetical protein
MKSFKQFTTEATNHRKEWKGLGKSMERIEREAYANLENLKTKQNKARIASYERGLGDGFSDVTQGLIGLKQKASSLKGVGALGENLDEAKSALGRSYTKTYKQVVGIRKALTTSVSEFVKTIKPQPGKLLKKRNHKKSVSDIQKEWSLAKQGFDRIEVILQEIALYADKQQAGTD